MISEIRIARGYASFWRTAAPTMELFVKRCNADIYSRNFEPLASIVDPSRRSVVNLLAFELFEEVCRGGHNLTNLAHALSDADVINGAIAKLSVATGALTQEEIRESRELARRMWLHFHHPRSIDIVVKPFFHGCGLVTSCFGDVIICPSVIVEMKDGDRPYRSYEFRQLSVYAALFYNRSGNLPSHLQVLNSRRGTFVSIEIEDFARQVAGQSASNYLYGIIRMMSESTVSQ